MPTLAASPPRCPPLRLSRVPDFPPLYFSCSLLRAALNNLASNQGKLQPLYKQMLLKKMLLPESSPEHRHRFPQGQVGARGPQGEGSCFFSFTKRLQGTYTKDSSAASPSPASPSATQLRAWSPPNLVEGKSLTGPQLPRPRCRDSNLSQTAPARRSCAPHVGPVPVICRIRVRLELPHAGGRNWDVGTGVHHRSPGLQPFWT